MFKFQSRGRLVAIVTGFISVIIGILYLLLIFILDARGPMLPPPPEAMGVMGVPFFFLELVQQFFLKQL